MNAVPCTTGRNPAVTFAMFTFNQAPYVREAVLSALGQDCEPIEIILSDDCSSDDTFAIMQETVAAYRGPHRVVVRQERPNRGLIGHINAVLGIAGGEYIVLAAGDDLSRTDRVAVLMQEMAARPLLIHSGFDFMDEAGRPLAMKKPYEALLTGDLMTIAAARALYVGATGCWHRDLFEKYGLIEAAGAYEDLVMGYRAALAGRVAYVNRSLVRYRIGTGITTRPEEARAKVLRTCRATIASFEQRLADTRRFFPERGDLIARIEKERLREEAVIAWYSDRPAFLRRYTWRVSVQTYFVGAALARMRQRFAAD